MRIGPRAAAAFVVMTLAFAPAPAAAVTVEQIVSLARAGVSEAVILALLERDGTVLTIAPEQLVSLKRDGLSDTLITAMLKNGREEAEDAARAVSASKTASILASLDAAPDVVVVGHGPDRPNTTHTEDYYRDFRDGVRLPAAGFYGSPYPIPYASFRRGLGVREFKSPAYTPPVFVPPVFVPPSAVPPAQSPYQARDRMLCLAQVNTAVGRGPAYVTECPAIMQRSVRGR
jgi:hypothetical protein